MKLQKVSVAFLASAMLIMPLSTFTAVASESEAKQTVTEIKTVPITAEKLIGDWHIYKVIDKTSGEDVTVSKGIYIDWIYTFSSDGSVLINDGSGISSSVKWQIVSGEVVTNTDETLVYDGTDLIHKEDVDGCSFYWRRVARLGDPTGDGIIDAVDASKVLKSYAVFSTGTESPTEQDIATSDLNKDGLIDAVDASRILIYYAYRSTSGTKSLEEYFELKL
jgi:hypothetical protein